MPERDDIDAEINQDGFRRPSLVKALPGPLFQCLAAMSYMLEAIRKEAYFTIGMERANVGAFDDIIIKYFEDAEFKNLKKSLYIQAKHGYDQNSYYEPINFTTSAKELEKEVAFYKYFKDWRKYFSEAPETTQFVFFSNHQFKEKYPAFKSCFVKCDEFDCFTDDFIEGEGDASPQNLRQVADRKQPYKFDTQEYNTFPLACFRFNIFHAIRTKGGNNIQDEEIKKFLKSIRFKLNQPHIEKYEDDTKEKVVIFFKGKRTTENVFYLFYVEVLRWLRQIEDTEWSSNQLKAMLRAFEAKSVILGEWVGKSELLFRQNTENVQYYFNRTNVIEGLKNKISELLENSHYTNLWIHGEKNIGKSLMISALFLSNEAPVEPGNYIYIDCEKARLDESIFKIEPLQLIIIDNFSSLDEIMAFVEKATKKKLIIICNNGLLDENIDFKNSQNLSYEIPFLCQQEIKDYLGEMKKDDHTLKFGKKVLQLKAIANLQSGGLYEYMQYPETLKKICELSKPPKSFKKTKFNPISSPYMHDGPINFEPIMLDAKQIFPLYSIDDIVKLKEFNRSKCVYYDNGKILEDFKQGVETQADKAEKCKFIWINLTEITIEENDQNLMEILYKAPEICNEKELKNTEELKNRIKDKNISILLLGYRDICSKWPQRLVNDLLHLPNCVIFTQCNIEQFEGLQFSLRFQEEQYYFEYKNEQASVLPNGSAVVSYPIENILCELVKLAKSPSGLICTEIVADGGAGKSTTLKSLYYQYINADLVKWEDNYYYIIYVPLSYLIHPNLKSNCLLDVVMHFLTKNNDKFFENALKKDLSEKKILFLLDGWDELNVKERKAIEPILNELSDYQHMVVTTRPKENLFFNVVNRYKLKKFDKKKITEFVYNFFKSDTNPKWANEFSEKAIAAINKPINREALKIIGLPLQCHLLCEAWYPQFELLCQGDDVELPWDKTSILTAAYLYSQFVISRLRKNFTDQYHVNRRQRLGDAEICIINNHFLAILQEAGYKQVFFNHRLKIKKDYYGQYVRRLGLIDEEDGAFAHKTYAEYFAALYLTNLLLTNKDEAIKLIFQYRYQRHYRLIFNFMARIISNENTILPRAQTCISDFWRALLKEPRDFIGIAEKEVLEACYKHSNRDKLAEIFDETGLKELSGSVNIQDVSSTSDQRESQSLIEQSSSLEQDDSSDDEEQDIFSDSHESSSAIMPSVELIDFIPPNLPKEYVKQAYMIQALSVLSYSGYPKRKAFNWLVKTLKTTYSFRVQEACIEKLSKLDMFDNTLKEILKSYLDSGQDIRSYVHENIVDYFVERKVNLNNLGLSENLFTKIFDIFFKERISKNEFSWLLSQRFSKQQFMLLLDSLEEAGFSTQKKVLIKLTEKRGENYLDYIEDALKSEGVSSSLQFFCQYVLLKHARYKPYDYMDNILKLEYNSDNLQIIAQLRKPLRKLLSKQEPNNNIEIYKAEWRKKIYDFTFQAVEERMCKNDIPKLVAELVKYQEDFDKMQRLLNILLDPKADEGFWDCDAVKPSLPHLLYYFSKPYADYLFYKVTHQNKYLRMPLSYLFKRENILKFRDDKARELFVGACMRIYKKMMEKEEKISGYDDPAYFASEVEPDVFLRAFLNEQNGEISDIEFFKRYFNKTKYALVIHSEEILVYASDCYKRIPITNEQKDFLFKFVERKMLVSSGLKEPIATLDQNNTKFIITCPASFFSKDISRKRKRPQKEMTTETFFLETSLLQENKKRRNKERSDSIKLQHVSEFEAEESILKLTLWMSKIEFDELNKNDERQLFGLLPYEATDQSGNCLFASVAAFEPNTTTEADMRERAVNYIRTDLQLTKYIIEGCSHEHLLTKNGKITYQTLDHYLELMRMPQTWGTQIELLALARSLKRPIAVLTPNNQYDHIIEEDVYRNNEPIFLNYVRQSHYEPLAVSDNKNAIGILNEIRVAIEERNNEREQNLQQGSGSNMVL